MPRVPWHLVVARFVGGTGIGIASMLSPMYIAEISPARLRGGLISMYQLAITVGVLAAYLSNYGLAELARFHPEFYGSGIWRWVFVDEVWRGMLLAGVFPAGVLFLLLLFVPESPRWLTKQGLSAKAREILERVNGRDAAAREMAEIEETIAQESGSIGQLFHRGMRLALLIGIVLPFFSQISGINVIIYYGPTVLKTTGLGANAALYWQILFGVVASVATVVAMLTIDKLGRKPLLLGGIAGVGAMLALSGGSDGCRTRVGHLARGRVRRLCGILQHVLRANLLGNRVRDFSDGDPRSSDVDIDLLAVDGLHVGGPDVSALAGVPRPDADLLALRPDYSLGIFVCVAVRPRDERQDLGANRTALGALMSLQNLCKLGEIWQCPTSP